VRIAVRLRDTGSGIGSASVTIGDVDETDLDRRRHGRWVGFVTVRRFENT